MKKMIILAAGSLIASSALVFAAGNGDHSHDNQHQGMAMMHGKHGGMMSAQMQQKMASMKADMQKIQKETDPARRKALIQAHMKEMKSAMGMMKNQKKAMMEDKHQDKMTQMETRLAMMEAMVEQIMNTSMMALNPDDPAYTMD